MNAINRNDRSLDRNVPLFSAEAYSEPSQTSKMELLANGVKLFFLLFLATSFGTSSILDVWLCSEYTSVINHKSTHRSTETDATNYDRNL